MVPGTGYLNRIVICPFWQLVHSFNRLPEVITEHQATLLPDNVEKQVFMKTYAVCKHTKQKTTSTGNNTFLFHTTQKTKKKIHYATSIQIPSSGRIGHLISGAIWYIPSSY